MLTVIGASDVKPHKGDANLNLRLTPSDVERSGIWDGCDVQEDESGMRLRVTRVREVLWNFSVFGLGPDTTVAMQALLNVVKYFNPSEEDWTRKFRVPSESSDEIYEVTEHVGGFWTCTCKGYQYRHDCKHIKEVR